MNHLKEKVFLKLFETAKIAKLYPNEYQQYEASVNAYRDIFNIQNTAFEKGKLEEKIEIAKNALNMNLPIDAIVSLTGLSKEEINKLIS